MMELRADIGGSANPEPGRPLPAHPEEEAPGIATVAERAWFHAFWTRAPHRGHLACASCSAFSSSKTTVPHNAQDACCSRLLTAFASCRRLFMTLQSSGGGGGGGGEFSSGVRLSSVNAHTSAKHQRIPKVKIPRNEHTQMAVVLEWRRDVAMPAGINARNQPMQRTVRTIAKVKAHLLGHITVQMIHRSVIHAASTDGGNEAWPLQKLYPPFCLSMHYCGIDRYNRLRHYAIHGNRRVDCDPHACAVL